MYLVTEEICLGLILMVLFMVYQRGNVLLYSVAGYIFTQGILNVHYPQILSKYLKTDIMQSENLIAYNSAQSLIFLLVIIFFIMSIKNLHKAITALAVFMVAECAVILWAKYLAGHAPWGFLMTSTMDGMFLGMILPLMFFYSEKWKKVPRFLFRLLPVITIFVTDSAIGQGAMVLGLLLMYLNDRRMLLIPFALGLVALVVNPNLFNDSGRIDAYKWALEWFFTHAKIWFGTGVGTFWGLSYLIQKTMGVMNEGDALFTYLHSDWIQGLIELGIVGMVLVTTFFCNLLWRARKNRVIFASLVVYGICAFWNFPLRNIVSATLGMFLIRLTMEIEE